ncbi:MAG: homogentisate 1,2-dioxygenase [Bacteroidetes bacterium]|nr:homogentisate 1,2-dioxygenase [Bacteroidota bacterium]
MPFYHKSGKIPQKRHTQFRQPDGSLYKEELLSTIGFDSISTNAYHINSPAKIKEISPDVEIIRIEEWKESSLRPYHFRTKPMKPEGDAFTGRRPVMYNNDVVMSVCRVKDQMEYFYKNALCDEVIFVHEGKGTLQTNLGYLKFREGDYIVIPRGVIYKLVHETENARLLVFESSGPITTPSRYRNEHGQLMEHAPYCERDIKAPEELVTFDEKGDFIMKIKKGEKVVTFHYEFHPFDIVGWDGYYFPWIFNIEDFMPITGKIHMPPPIHQTFAAPGFVICSFCPRLLDYHPQAVPIPYNHSNLDSDEMLYYVDGNFASRKGIDFASISLHPNGIPHGPHPGTVEANLGKKETLETAVMMDTFRPLKLAEFASEVNDPSYYLSWNNDEPVELINEGQ